MLPVIAVTICFLLMMKILFFLVYPTHFIDSTPIVAERIRKYSVIIQCVVAMLMVIAFLFLCTQLDIFTIMATGLFWICVFAGAYFPFISRVIDHNELFRQIQEDSNYIKELRILQLPILVFCIITIAIFLFGAAS